MITFSCRKCVVALLCVWASGIAGAQQSLDVHALIGAAQQHLPLLKQKQSLLRGAEASVTELRHSFLPQIRLSEQLNIGSNNSLAGSLFTYGITPSSSAGVRAENNWQPATANVAVLYGEYELYNFGLNAARLGYAGATVALQRADLEKEQYQLAAEVTRLYLQIMKQQYRLRADTQNIERYANLFQIIHALTTSGLRAGADSSLAQAELSRTRMSFNQTKGRLDELREQLSYLTGIDPSRLLLDTIAEPWRLQARLPAYGANTLTHPLLGTYDRKVDLLRQNEILIRRSYRPRILLSASAWARGSSIQFNDQFKSLETGLGYQRFNYLTGVTFTYNLLNGIYRKDRLAINRYQLAAGEYERQQQALLLLSAARRAENNVRSINDNLREMLLQYQAAETAYRQKLAQYKAGLISLIDLTNATFVLYRSQTDQVETLSDWYLAQLDSAAANGRLYPFIQSINP